MTTRSPSKDGSFEREEDLTVEKLVIDHIATALKCNYEKLERYDFVDFRLHKRQKTHSFIEVRRRNNNHDKFKYQYVSEKKWRSLALLGLAFNVPVYFVFVYDDTWLVVDVTRWGAVDVFYYDKGRENCDTKRSTDNEVMIKLDIEKLVDINRWIPLKKKETG